MSKIMARQCRHSQALSGMPIMKGFQLREYSQINMLSILSQRQCKIFLSLNLLREPGTQFNIFPL